MLPRLRVEAAGQTWIAAAGPLRTASGVLIGEYAGLRARQAELAPFTALQRSVLYAFLGALAVALVISLLLARQITDPLRRLVAITREVAEGRYSGEVDIRSRDEIGELADAFQGMLSELREKQRLVEFLGSSATSVQTQVDSGRADPPRPAPATSASGRARRPLRDPAAARRRGHGCGLPGVRSRAQGAGGDQDPPARSASAIPSLLERFKQEIRLARQISHPNVVRTHDLGEAGGIYFITMEFVEGTGLDEVIRRRGALPLAGDAHHRPAAVPGAGGRPRSGHRPSRHQAAEPGGGCPGLPQGDGLRHCPAGGGAPGAVGQGLTAAGSIIGTPEYMAPEQLIGQPVDGRADLYAAGIVLYECATGRRLFTGDSFATVLMKQVQEPPPDPRSMVPGLPEDLAAVLLKALAKEPEHRWQSATELLHALEAIRA